MLLQDICRGMFRIWNCAWISFVREAVFCKQSQYSQQLTILDYFYSFNMKLSEKQFNLKLTSVSRMTWITLKIVSVKYKTRDNPLSPVVEMTQFFAPARTSVMLTMCEEWLLDPDHKQVGVTLMTEDELPQYWRSEQSWKCFVLNLRLSQVRSLLDCLRT